MAQIFLYNSVSDIFKSKMWGIYVFDKLQDDGRWLRLNVSIPEIIIFKKLPANEKQRKTSPIRKSWGF